MKIAFGILKRIAFLLLAALVFVGFVYPFFAEPQKYEDKARAMTEERIASGSVEVDQSYIEESVNDAMTAHLDTIFRNALLIAAASALVIFCLSVRPPHDCGGFNLFNPIGLVFTALITVLLGCALRGVLTRSEIIPNDSAFLEFTAQLFRTNSLLFVVMIPLVLELVFRGIIFSYLEKIHFSVALVITPVLYAAAAHIIVGAYTKWSQGSADAAVAAFWVALIIGFTFGVITWRMRSVIPAALAHVFLAWAVNPIGFWDGSIAASPVALLVILGVVLAIFVGLFTFAGRKVKWLAYDFPFTKHHAWMNDWLYGKLKRKNKEEAPAAVTEEASETKEGSPAEDKPAEEAPAEEAPAEEAPAEEAPAEEAPAEEAPAEEAPAGQSEGE